MGSEKLYGMLIRASSKWFVHVPDIGVFIELESVDDYIRQIEVYIHKEVNEKRLVIERSTFRKSAIFYVKSAVNRMMLTRGLFPNEFRTQLIEVRVPVNNK